MKGGSSGGSGSSGSGSSGSSSGGSGSSGSSSGSSGSSSSGSSSGDGGSGSSGTSGNSGGTGGVGTGSEGSTSASGLGQNGTGTGKGSGKGTGKGTTSTDSSNTQGFGYTSNGLSASQFGGIGGFGNVANTGFNESMTGSGKGNEGKTQAGFGANGLNSGIQGNSAPEAGKSGKQSLSVRNAERKALNNVEKQARQEQKARQNQAKALEKAEAKEAKYTEKAAKAEEQGKENKAINYNAKAEKARSKQDALNEGKETFGMSYHNAKAENYGKRADYQSNKSIYKGYTDRAARKATNEYQENKQARKDNFIAALKALPMKMLNLVVPGLGNMAYGFVSGAAGSTKGNSFMTNLGRTVAYRGRNSDSTNTNTATPSISTPSTGSGPSNNRLNNPTNTSDEEKIIRNTNFGMNNKINQAASGIHTHSTVSDEKCKSFAKASLFR